MKKITKLFLTGILLIFTFSVSGQTMTTFRQSYDLGAFDITGGMVQTPAREFVIAGLNNSFGPYYGDAVKIDTAGNIVWAKAYNAGFATNFSDIKNVSTGGFIITGSSTSGGGGAILLRIDALGNVIWAFRYQLPNFSAGKTSNEFGNAVIETTDGGFLVGGGVDYFWDGVSAATVDTTSAMGFKVNSSGVLQWSRVWTIATANPDEHFINDVAESADGYFFVGESSEGAGTGGDYPRNSLIIKTSTAGALTYIRRWGAGNTTSQGINSALRLSTGNILLGGYDDMHAFIVSISGVGAVTPTVIFNRRLNGSAFGSTYLLQDIMENADGNYSMIGTQIQIFPVAFNTMIGKINSTTTNWIFGRTYAPIGLSAILPEGGLCSDQGYYVSMTDQQMAGFNFNIIRTNTVGQTSDPAVGCSGGAVTPPLGTESITFSTPTSLNYNLMTSSSFAPVVNNMSPTRVAHCLNIPSPLNTTGASSNVTCNGACNGTASVSATGGTGPYTYTWTPSGGNAATASGLCPNTYTCSITDAASATSTETFVITQPSAVTATQGQGTISCNAGTTTASVSASGGTGGYTYTWSPSGGNAATASGLTAGNYTSTISDANGCIITRTFVITQPPAITLTANQTQVTCTSSGAATVTATGGTPTYTAYTWNPSVSTTSVATGLSAGNYTVVVTDNSGCQRTTTVTITANNAPPSVTATASGSLNCNTTSTTVVASTTTSPATYTWTGPGITGGANTATATINTGGTYNYTVTNPANGCQAAGSVSVTQNNTNPLVTASTSGSINCTTSTIQVVASTTASPVSYTWTGPGVVSGANTASATVNTGGTYNYTVVNTLNNCSATGTIAVTQNTTAPTATAGTTGSVTCSNTTINLTSGLSGLSYTWTAPAGSSITGGTNNQNTTGSGAGTYTVRVTNAVNGCTNIATIAANVNTTAPVPTAGVNGLVTCGSATVSLTSNPGAMNYTWTAPAGSSITGGVNNQNTTGSGGGTYTVIVQNPANGCSTSTVVTASTNTTPPSPSINTTPTITCSNPTVNLSSSTTGVTYTWTGPGIVGSANNSTVNVNQAGTYSLFVTSAVNGCTNVVSASVTNNTVSPTTTPISTQTITCATPSVQLIGSANPSSCTVVWTGGVCAGANSYTATACSAGTYTYIATDPSNGCQSAAQVATVVPSAGAPTATVSNTGTITCLTTSVQVVSTTTTSPVTYTWSGPGIIGSANTGSINVNMGGVYSLTLTNTSNSCTSIITNSVTIDNAAVTPTTTSSNVITCSNPTSVLTATAGTGTYTYNWSGPGIVGSNTLSAITSSLGGTYSVTVTNTSNGCTGTETLSVVSSTNVPTAVNASPSSFTLSCLTPSTSITATSTGGTTYSWTAPGTGTILSGGSTATASISGPGVYSVVATGTNGCSAAAATATMVADANTPAVTVSANTVSITCVSSTTGVTVTPTSTVAIASYSWSPASGISSGSNTTTPVFNTPGTYSCLITASNGCTTTTFVTVANNSVSPSVITPAIANISCGNPNVTINPNYTPGSGLTYTWSGTGIVGSPNNSSVTVNQSGTYTVSVFDTVNGCSNTATMTVTGSTIAPTATVTSTSSIGIGCSSTNSMITLDAASTPSSGVTYSWSTSATTQSISTTVPGIYTVIVTDASNGCFVATQYTVDNNSTAPSNTVVANSIIPCGATTATLNGGSNDPGVIFTWTGPSVISGSNSATAIADQPGTYTLTVTNPTTGCMATNTVVVSSGVPTASFTADVTTGFTPQTVVFTNGSIGAVTYNWIFGDGSVSTSTNTSNTYNTSGTYTVMLIASNGLCSDTAYAVIVIEDGFTLEIPNVFTPNNDGTNDFFTIKSTGVKEIELQIFNRWGQLMYSFNGAKAAWDGITNSGEKATDGTYFYFIIATGFDGKEYKKNGPVGLFR